MNINQIPGRRKPALLKFPVGDIPHLTIETNLNCNIKCRSCYNIDNQYIKSYELICSEIDQGKKRRSLRAITLIGGEPTLHPDLPKIIAYIKKQELICQMLTNGILFLNDSEDKLLDSLVDIGLDKILLHIDEGQLAIHNDLDKVTRYLFDKFEKRKIFFSLSNTVFHDTQQLIPDKSKAYASYKYFDGILTLPSRNIEKTIQPGFDAEKYPTMIREYLGLKKILEVNPVAYFPTSLDDHEISWLFYFFFINARTGKVFSRSISFIGFFFKFFRIVSQKNAFALSFKPWQVPIVFIGSAMIELLINPLRMKEFFGIITKSGFLSAIRIHTIVIQNLPEYHAEKNSFHICYHCPDATMRNGMLTPLCLADIINPLPGRKKKDVKGVENIYQTVYRHLEEIS